MGEQFTAADVVIGSGLRWGMMFKLLPERPEFVAYVQRLENAPGAAECDGARSATCRCVSQRRNQQISF